MSPNRPSKRASSSLWTSCLSVAFLPVLFFITSCATKGPTVEQQINALRFPPTEDIVIDNTGEPTDLPPIIPIEDPSVLQPDGTPPPLSIRGNRIVLPDGEPITLKGVNIAGLEWDDEGQNNVRSLKVAVDEWGAQIVRIPLSQDRWFGRSPTQTDDGSIYRAIVDELVTEASRRGVYILLELHWNNAGSWGRFIGQHKMPDQLSLHFWRAVAQRYANHPAVLFGPYNEPHDVTPVDAEPIAVLEGASTDVHWDTWLHGGILEEEVSGGRRHDPAKPIQRGKTTVRYRAPGHQQLYDVIRAAGAENNIISVGGLHWAYDLAGIVDGHQIEGHNVLYETHIYPNKDWNEQYSWENAWLNPSRTLPVLVGEWGANPGGQGNMGGSGAAEFLDRMVKTLRENPHLSWTAWDFHPSAGPTLIQNWEYEPTQFGEIVKRELQRED